MSLTREQFAHISDSQWNTLLRMSGLFGEAALPALLTEDSSQHTAATNASSSVNTALSDQFGQERETLTAQFQHEQAE